MNRNQNSHFALDPQINIGRSRFDRDSTVKLSLNSSELVPFFLDEILPGDSFNIKTSKVIRAQTMLTPVMDNIYLDTYYFFIPARLLWSHWKEFNGENKTGYWIPQTEYSIPQITAPVGGWQVGTIADYMGLPVGVDNVSVSALPFRAYGLVCNEWFRSQNLTNPVNVPVDDVSIVGSNGDDQVTDIVKGGKPFKVAKYFDYFTGALPAPQKGPDTNFLGSDQVPVVPTSQFVGWDNFEQFSVKDGQVVSGTDYIYPTIYAPNPSGSWDPYKVVGQRIGSLSGDPGSNTDFTGTVMSATVENPMSSTPANGYSVVPINLWAQLGDSSVTTINQLRLAFQIQKLYEKDARGGTRYIEILKTHFGVTSPDSRLQRPEYLGGNRVPIHVNQVVQSSSTAEGTTPQGTVTAYSQTADVHSDFMRSFTEHGYILGVMCIRYDHTYQQGIERFWSRKSRFDYYWPVFANIGEQAILNKEIFAQGTAEDDEVFGYQEAWADYRYKPSRVCGEMRSAYANSLDVWHLADDYSQLPALGDAWIREDKANIDRVLAVKSTLSNQFFGDIYIQNTCTRAMPLYSIPGLIDHN